ncbi:MAG: phenylalanine 4-monooxygenase [Curvibacter sp.]|jgi:phenylalanine-4-hydroxylase
MDCGDGHGLAQPGYRPARADWTVDQQWCRYTPQDHATWRTLFERQTGLLPARASQAWLEGLNDLPIAYDRIPDFAQLNEVLHARSGWQVVAVPGLVPDEVFFEHLANRRFPAGNFIRQPHELDYLQEPDVFHDVYGHVPILMNPAMADYMQAYGEGGLKAQRLGYLPQLARVYWYTVEFGLVQESAGLRIYGAGILSSATESRFSLEDDSPHRIAFDTERVLRTRYRIDDFQESYFVLRDLDQLLELARIDFTPLYARIAGQPELEPGDLQPLDTVLQRGSGHYHHTRAPRV